MFKLLDRNKLITSEMILPLLLIFPFVYSTKSSEKDLLSLETGYHQKATHEPMTNYYSPAVHYNSYEQSPQLEYIPHPYPAHETPKSDYISSYYKSGPKKMSYPMSDSPYIKPYSSSASYPPLSYSYGAPPPKPYDSYKPKKYSASYSLPIYQSEYMKYKPNKKAYKMSHSAPDPHPSVAYPIDDYYQYKQPDPYSAPPMKPTYPYQPEYQSYSTTKAYPPQTYSDYPKHSYSANYSPPPPSPTSYYSYDPKSEYPKTTYDDEPYYSSNSYPPKY